MPICIVPLQKWWLSTFPIFIAYDHMWIHAHTAIQALLHHIKLCAAVTYPDAQLLLTRVVQELYKPLHECPGITVTDEYWFDMMHVVSRSTLCCALLARLSHTCRVHAAVLGACVWVGLAWPVDAILTSRGGGRAARCATNAGRHGGGQWDRRRGARRGG